MDSFPCANLFLRCIPTNTTGSIRVEMVVVVLDLKKRREGALVECGVLGLAASGPFPPSFSVCVHL